MHVSATGSRAPRSLLTLSVAMLAVFIVSIPAAAFNADWTKPKRVFDHDAPPTHSMVTDGSARVHIATERGGSGVWYVTNASGSWQRCQVSDGNDRRPSIALDGGTVHIAFARLTDGQKGVYTTSSDQPASAAGCGWAVVQRYHGSASHAALGAHDGKLSVAFRTGGRKLKFLKGSAATTDWAAAEVIEGTCCTSPVALDLTTGGAPRVAYGDGTSRANGLKYATRTSKGWKKTRAHGGRIKHVALVLDKTPGFASNAPHLAYVVKRKGTWFATKSGSGVQGRWSKRYIGKASMPPDLTKFSNVVQIVYGKNGNLFHTRSSGGIWFGAKLSGGGTDSKPQLHGGKLTFSRKSGTKGIFFTQPK